MADTFFSELKRAREQKGVTLEEISDATLINLKMLQALERGDVNTLPQAYVRAFIREYAALVGLDPRETMTKYDSWLSQETIAPKVETPIPPSPKEETVPRLVEPVTRTEEKGTSSRRETPSDTKRNVPLRIGPVAGKLALALGALAFVNVLFWNWLNEEPSSPTKETPFLEAYKDQQAERGFQDSSALADTTRRALTTGESLSGAQRALIPASALEPTDSMTLVGMTSDSVWMEIVLDDDVLTEHLLPPNTTISWRAMKEFWISAIGNPLALQLRLNGKPIAIPYRKGYVTRDLRITRDSLRTR